MRRLYQVVPSFVAVSICLAGFGSGARADLLPAPGYVAAMLSPLASPSALTPLTAAEAAKLSPAELAQLKPAQLLRVPKPPIVAWYQCPYWKQMKHWNLNASGAGLKDAQQQTANGVCSLMWSYGPESPYAHNAKYFIDQFCGQAKAGYAGTAVDEWTTGHTQAQLQWCAEGLRETKRLYPNFCLAVWVTQPTPLFCSLVKDGTIDLALIEGYSFVPDHPDWSIPFPKLIKDRVEFMKRQGLLSKTIVCLGELSGKTDRYGKRMTGLALVRETRYLAKHYPGMPGIGFYGVGDHDPKTKELTFLADRLAGYYYGTHWHKPIKGDVPMP